VKPFLPLVSARGALSHTYVDLRVQESPPAAPSRDFVKLERTEVAVASMSEADSGKTDAWKKASVGA
jgi:hypothetical protein